MNELFEIIEKSSGFSVETQLKIFSSAVIIFALLVLRSIVLRIVWQRTEDVRARYVWRKSLIYVVVILSILLIGRVWFENYQSLATYLGLVSAGLVIALKDPVTNFAGWIFILIRRPFTLGDRVQIGEHSGDVIDIRLFMFTLMEIGNWVDADQSTGRVIHVPNGKVFTEMLANYSKGFQFIWNEVPVLVTFESNWKAAKEILQKIGVKHAEHLSAQAQEQVKEAGKKMMIFYTKLTPIVYTSVKDCGVMLTVRYLCEPRRRRSSEQGVWEDILDEFAARGDIDFAYPTQRFYNNMKEGKEDARAPSGDK